VTRLVDIKSRAVRIRFGSLIGPPIEEGGDESASVWTNRLERNETSEDRVNQNRAVSVASSLSAFFDPHDFFDLHG
jgi:hypothetical protein